MMWIRPLMGFLGIACFATLLFTHIITWWIATILMAISGIWGVMGKELRKYQKEIRGENGN